MTSSRGVAARGGLGTKYESSRSVCGFVFGMSGVWIVRLIADGEGFLGCGDGKGTGSTVGSELVEFGWK